MWSAVFPGQGSQFVGMGKFFFDNFSSTREKFEEASDTLSLDFKKLCFTGPEKELILTSQAQPALLLTSVAAHEVIQETTAISFHSAAGHSVGEYAALVTGGSLQFHQALQAVRKRGEFMQSAVPPGKGGMLAILGLEASQVNELCQWAEKESGLSPLEPANFNSPTQVVVSGTTPLVKWVQENASRFLSQLNKSTKRVKFIPLKVSAPFHCSMMEPAEKKMALVLEKMEFKKPLYPIIQNHTATPTTDPSQLRTHLIAQISAPVLWVDCVKKIKETGTKNCLELGPGKTLGGLIKAIDKENIKTFHISSLKDLKTIEGQVKKDKP